MNKKVKETLERQMEILSERARNEGDYFLLDITDTMVRVAEALKDGGGVGQKVKETLEKQVELLSERAEWKRPGPIPTQLIRAMVRVACVLNDFH